MSTAEKPDSVKPVYCDECGQRVHPPEVWEQEVEGGAAVAIGHRECIRREWGDDR